MRRKRELASRAMRYLDIPSEVLPGGFSVLISGTGSLTVRGCRRILQYGTECIRLRLGDRRILNICGNDLLCTVFEAGLATVEGKLQSVSFEEAVRRAT